jgi:hypothetical protein
MQHVTPAVLLRAWELGTADPQPSARARALLGAVCPELDESDYEALTLNERDRFLFALREQVFGSRFEGLAPCPNCGVRFELTFGVADIRSNSSGHAPAPLAFTLGEFAVRVRPPCLKDLACIVAGRELSAQRNELLERLVIEASQSGKPCDIADLPESVAVAIEEALAEADPAGVTDLSLTCDACGRGWSAPFDIAAYLWSELDSWAVTLLREVHVLAQAYAWKESDLIAMNPWRRRLYLEMLGT